MLGPYAFQHLCCGAGRWCKLHLRWGFGRPHTTRTDRRLPGTCQTCKSLSSWYSAYLDISQAGISHAFPNLYVPPLLVLSYLDTLQFLIYGGLPHLQATLLMDSAYLDTSPAIWMP